MRYLYAVDIPEAYVRQFSANVHMLSEQRMSRLRRTVTSEPVTGEAFSEDRIGTTQDAANPVTGLHGDTPLNNTPNSRRWGYIQDYDVADLLNKTSQVKLLIDPESKYTIRHAGVLGRTMDTTIISALGGTAVTGKTGTGTQALPSAQKIAHGSLGLTVKKLIDAKTLLDAAEVDEIYERFLVVSAAEIADLLADDKVTSADYNTIQALVQGKINQYLGFTFIRSQRLVVASSVRKCYAYVAPAVLFGTQVEPNTVVAPRPDKRMATQIYTSGSFGAVRIEDEQVVEISTYHA